MNDHSLHREENLHLSTAKAGHHPAAASVVADTAAVATVAVEEEDPDNPEA
jgi:hypothetical protein